jgi:non-heme chloroperoxidase
MDYKRETSIKFVQGGVHMAFLLTSDGIKLHYEVKGEGEPIVLIHGWSQNSSVYLPQVEKLSKDYKVVTYDFRGHGKSDRPEHGLTLKRYGADLEELMEELKLENVTLVGWSMGASTTFDYVRNYGVNRLKSITIFDMTPKLVNDENWKLGLYHGKYGLHNALHDLTTINGDISEFAKEFLKTAIPYLTEDMLESQLKFFLENNTPHVLSAMWHAMGVNDYRDVLPQMTVPTQIVYGENSTLYSKETAEYIVSEVPDARIVPFANCTHLLVAENPEKTTEVIRDIARI